MMDGGVPVWWVWWVVMGLAWGLAAAIAGLAESGADSKLSGLGGGDKEGWLQMEWKKSI